MKKDRAPRSDGELIDLYKDGDVSAVGVIFERYKPLVKAKARLYYLEGGDHEDLLQEGMLGLYKAVRQYDAGKEAAFSTFAALLINRQMLSAIEAAGRKKHRALNESVSLDAVGDIEENLPIRTSPDPESIYMEKEAADELLKNINACLSPLERHVLDLYLDGLDYRRIAGILKRSEKSIDNALQRIRAKIKERQK